MYRGKIILQGHNDVNTRLWMVDLKGIKQARAIANPYIPAINKITNNLIEVRKMFMWLMEIGGKKHPSNITKKAD